MSPTMPDIANHTTAQREGTLDWVGMSNIEMPIMLASKNEADQMISAYVDAFVNLKEPQAKGIHMSRLYLALDELSTSNTLNFQTLTALLDTFVTTHQELSDSARVVIRFDYHLRRKSLISGKEGWKAYPVTITGQLANGTLDVELAVDIRYSSTCPCSAALARQLIQKAFMDKFSGQAQIPQADMHEWLGSTEGIVATPHSQRSIGQMKVKLAEHVSQFPIKSLIDVTEASLKTPVQAAVKREDEQEFALLNGQNLMFCEDAARHLQHTLNEQDDFSDYWLKINHLESLHAHDAVSITTKGVVGGYRS